MAPAVTPSWHCSTHLAVLPMGAPYNDSHLPAEPSKVSLAMTPTKIPQQSPPFNGHLGSDRHPHFKTPLRQLLPLERPSSRGPHSLRTNVQAEASHVTPA